MPVVRRNRLGPKMPPQYYKTYRVSSPLETHTRKAKSCAEADCEAYRDGWVMHKDKMTPAMIYAVTHAGKRYREIHVAAGHTYFQFEPGQNCFRISEHRVSLDRPEFYLVGRGLTGTFSNRKARQHTQPEFWIEDMQHHLDRIRKAIEE